MDPLASALAARIDAVLPQTQCTRCGYDGCRPYAEAIAGDGEAIDRCPPGGLATLAQLAALTGRTATQVDPECGRVDTLRVARIDEARCIGCALCIAACPVDAIIGGPKRMHAVLRSWCTGCELCLPPCPVDCIELVAAERPWTPLDADHARRRHDARAARLARGERVRDRLRVAAAPAAASTAAAERRARVTAALERARARRGKPESAA